MTNKVQLSIQDIASAIQIIDLSVARGAIRGEEMFQIGALRQRMEEFVKATQKIQETVPQDGSSDGDKDIESLFPDSDASSTDKDIG
ncbi:MAG: hypothetical protein COA84_13360 [Robiginitomaculum sp.]|nr:MAG: hypothetical protein COA84_13360 [Robiginitomaculum sp.]